MAWAVIFGLVFATFLTLILVPVLYYLADRLLYGIGYVKQQITKEKMKVYVPEKMAA